jgi:hypothetical protein
VLNRVIAIAALVAEPGLIPLLSRHRIHRLARSFSYGLRDLVEPHRRGSFTDAQLTQPPRVAGVFHIPAAAEQQLLDLATCVDQQCPAGVALRGTCPAGKALLPRLPPGVLTLIKDRGNAVGGEETDDSQDGARCDLDGAVVVSALQGVLDLESQVGIKTAQIDTFVAGRRIVLIAAGVLLDIRAAVFLPADPV